MGPSPTTPPVPTPLAISRAVEKLFLDYHGKTKAVRHPHDVFQEQLRDLNAPYEREKSELMGELAAASNENARRAVAERLSRKSSDYGASLNTLRTRYLATAERDKLSFDQTLGQHNEKLLRDFLRVFGRSLVEAGLKKHPLQQQGDVRESPIVFEAAQTTEQQNPTAQHVSSEAGIKHQDLPGVAPAQPPSKQAVPTQAAIHSSMTSADNEITPPAMAAETTVTQIGGPQRPLVDNPASSTAQEPSMAQESKTTGSKVGRTALISEVSEVASAALPSQPSHGKHTTASGLDQDRPLKRPRLEQPQVSPSIQSQEEWRPQAQIPFKDVYQDGKASQKYIIGRYFGVWCIFRCGKCNLFFADNPEEAAFQHLAGPAHERTPTLKMVIRELGVSVRGCNQKRRALNNEVASAFFARAEKGPPTQQKPPTEHLTTLPRKRPSGADSDEYDPSDYEKVEISSSKRSRRDAAAPAKNRHRLTAPEPRMKRRSSGAIIDPIPGQVYQAEWRNTKKWYAVLVLRTGSFSGLGIEGSIRDRHLEGDVPPCYKYDPETREFDGWEDGYEDGDPFVKDRWFPVMFFDGTPFPDGANPSWVAAKGLQLFDRNDSTIEFRDTVLEFLDERGLGQVDIAPASNTVQKHRKPKSQAALNDKPRRPTPHQKVSPFKTTSPGPTPQDLPQVPPLLTPATGVVYKRAKTGLSEGPKRETTQPSFSPVTQTPSSASTGVRQDNHESPPARTPAGKGGEVQKKPSFSEEPKRSTSRASLPPVKTPPSVSTGAAQDTHRALSVPVPIVKAVEAQTKPSTGPSKELNGPNAQQQLSPVDQTGPSSSAPAARQTQTESAPVDTNTSIDQQLPKTSPSPLNQQQPAIEMTQHLRDQATDGPQWFNPHQQLSWPMQPNQQDSPAPECDGEGWPQLPETPRSEQRGDRAGSKLSQILHDLQQLSDSKTFRPI